ncbi:MAG: creatininase family protein [Chloroflexota bacterium]|nr:creatininase family protein [Chloroflexota bacterium]MDE2839295.1 creatininase family protein [Chloroflexota bacterium]MDE2930417.1 creatininase family protein [Chloroflexota bacterium]
MLSFRNSTKQLADAGVDTAVISVGSTEQCGPCLPLHIDTLVAEYFARAFGERLNAYVLPTLPFNTAEEHASFTGTVTLRPSTVMLVLEEIVAGLRTQGFRKQVLTCGHGGSYWLAAFIKQINRQFADIVVVNAHQGGANVWEEARAHAGLAGRGEVHGGAESRALALYLAPDCVLPGAFGRAIPEDERAYMDYMTWEKIAPDGSWGAYAESDAEVATAEAGRALLEYFIAHQGTWLAEHLTGACKRKGIPV